MKLLFGQDAFVADWVATQIPLMHGGGFEKFAAIGVVDERGVLLGGVVYHDHRPAYRSIELSFASATPRWLTREIICSLLAYPFVQLDCLRVTGITPRKARAARRFLDKFGFKREGVVRRGFGLEDDAIISGLLQSEWRKSRFNRASC